MERRCVACISEGGERHNQVPRGRRARELLQERGARFECKRSVLVLPFVQCRPKAVGGLRSYDGVGTQRF
jgi:hypothetical protein